MRRGPPLPPSIFIGRATTKLPVGGSRSRFATFSKPATLSEYKITWAPEVLRLAIVDAGSVDSYGNDIPVLHQPSSRILTDPREVELRNGLRALQLGPQIGLAIVPAITPPRPNQQDAAVGKCSVLLLPGHEVLDRDQVVGVRAPGHVEDRRRANQAR